ncbi:hypothetical protein C7B77_23705 [Chamaesiphon polymorphus CCALA 037]|uniref:Uncharacterized protein n=2 Tax=Chamaesiphon TaxID=217161 RepID=A0A2T1FV53_9CYAN|nr:hypothetical protein C7B77_23705 [Chamaesiphon polymorphus CCALA 037]
MGCQVNDNLWVPARKLIWDESGYRSGNVKGAIQAIINSSIFHNYFSLSPLDRIDVTREIPGDFSRRMPLDRPEEMPQHLPHLGLSADLLDPIAYVARSGGYKQTDSFDVFPEIDPDSDGCYYFYFGLRELHLLPELKSTLSTLKSGDKIAVRGKEAIHIATNLTLGLLPGYIVAMDNENSGLLNLAIERINLGAIYTRHKIICSATCKGFLPFSTPVYQPIGDLYGKV